jgi:hypothetical protein
MAGDMASWEVWASGWVQRQQELTHSGGGYRRYTRSETGRQRYKSKGSARGCRAGGGGEEVVSQKKAEKEAADRLWRDLLAEWGQVPEEERRRRCAGTRPGGREVATPSWAGPMVPVPRERGASDGGAQANSRAASGGRCRGADIETGGTGGAGGERDQRAAGVGRTRHASVDEGERTALSRSRRQR